MGLILGKIFAFLIVFGILVFIHEFGHYLMAKLVGIRVEVFSFGYGKRLIGIKKKETDYRISLIPMGGYVKLLGEGMFAADGPVAPDDMMAKSRGQRFLVMVMGSIMNILLAVVLVAVINGIGVPSPEYQDQRPVIGTIDPGSPAEEASLKADDEILAIDGRKVRTWNDVEIAVGTRPDKVITLEILRGGRTLPVKLKTRSDSRYAMGYAGFLAKTQAQIKMITPGSPADKAGLLPGDVIVAIDDMPVFYTTFTPIIQKSTDKQIALSVERRGRMLTIPVTPRNERNIGIIGIFSEPKTVIKKYGFFPAIGESVKANLKNVFLIVRFLKDLFTGQASSKQLGGPLEIANVSYAAMKAGWIVMLSWIAIISLQLGVLNLFPIPVFDGGQIFVLALESIFRKDFSPKMRQIWMQIGFVIFVVLIAFVILNDFVKRMPNGWKIIFPFL